MPSSVKRFNNKAYTLTEVLIAVILIGILAGLAVPNYRKTIEASRASEAKADLMQIHAGQAYYKLNNGVYWDPDENTWTNPADIDATIRTTLATTYYTMQQIDATSGASFTAVVKRANASTKEFTIIQDGTITEAGSY